MAYTYDDFVTAATGAGLLEKFTDDDLNIAKNNPEYGLSALKLQQDLQGAKTTEQQLLAQEAINQLRTSYGNLNKSAQTSFQYDGQTEYQKLLDQVANMGSFSYDAQNDPSYGALKKTYLREGERARADTLAKVSAATGGAPSSYAVTAAQQAGDYYNTQFADLVPTLEQNAYQRYLNDFDAKLNQLGAMNTDREFDFNAYLQSYEQKQEAYNKLVALMTQYRYEPTAEEMTAAGMTQEQADAILGKNRSSSNKSTSPAGDGTPFNYDTNRVLYVQRELNKMGWDIPEDGVFGDETRKAYAEYQRLRKEVQNQPQGEINSHGGGAR